MTLNRQSLPDVSVIVPCYNEEKTIQLLLQAISDQSYPLEKIEVVIADAISNDRTREKIRYFQENQPALKIIIVDNTKRTIPGAINLAAEKASGKYLVRMDAHSIPNKEYLINSINLLEQGKAQNVGGIWIICAGNDSCIARAIARAVSHPLGAGDANYRISTKAGYVDTVPFGAYKKEDFIRMGGFDETLLANEDYEFNTRLRENGGKVWLDPSIQSKYFARNNLSELAIQYWRYGFWKRRMLLKYPHSLRWRQAIPPLFILCLVFFGIMAFLMPFARIILGIIAAIYLATLLSSSIVESIKLKDCCYMNLFLVFATIHFSWGSGFLYSFCIKKS